MYNHHNNFCLVDLGGSLAVASRGLFATGVSTDLSGEWNAIIRVVIRNLLANARLIQ